ncbi:MAG: DNA mismatch repair protein [Acidobacteriota bacterium]
MPENPALSVPDLLFLDARLSFDQGAVEELLELSFLGKEAAAGLERSLSSLRVDGDWDPALFADDLFLRDLVRETFSVELEGLRYPINSAFLFQVAASPPTSLDGVLFRQKILRELESEPEFMASARALYRDTARLLDLFKAPDHAAQLDFDAHRLDIFRQAKKVIDRMVSDFGDARSGLVRLAESGRDLQASRPYRRLSELLDFEKRQATLRVDLDIGADGEIHDLRLLEIDENTKNPHYLSRRRQLWHRVLAIFGGYRLNRRTILRRLLQRVYEEVAPSLVPLLQVLAHLEVYLAAFGFKKRLENEGYAVCLPKFSEDQPVKIDGLFNPLLLEAGGPPVPADLAVDATRPILLLTGPNSGGKTRLLQALAVTQTLGQAGLFVPARSARLQVIKGLFVSLVETETVHAAEGRLGREMKRIRSVFQQVGTPAMVILDELCSGTNPSEGIEIFDVVLRLLDRFDTAAFISTHFLDYAAGLEKDKPLDGLRFLQVAGDEHNLGRFQFTPGVARSSLAKATAERLGVTFEELSEVIDRRRSH